MAPINRATINKALPKYWRIKKRGDKTYYMYRVPAHLRDQHDGKQEISLGTSLSEAYQKFAEFYGADECITLMRELLDRYRMEIVPTKRKKTQKSNAYSLDRLRHSLGDNLVTTVDAQAIYTYRNQVAKAKSKKHANLDLEVLSHVFTNAIEWGVIPAPHPMTNKGVVKFQLKTRDRYVEDYELEAWASVANPFLVAYIVLKGTTGLRQQDLLTIRNADISDTELRSRNLKTGKQLIFPLVTDAGEPTTVKLALDVVRAHYDGENARRAKNKRLLPPVVSPWLFRTRKGTCYWNAEKENADSFASVWQRSMVKAIKLEKLAERFTEHDLRAKVGSDADSEQEAQRLLAHASLATTRKFYRRKGTKVVPAAGFSGGSKIDLKSP